MGLKSNQLTFLLMIGCLIFIYFYTHKRDTHLHKIEKKLEEHNKPLVIKWTSSGHGLSPKERYKDIVKEFGQPDVINPDKGGGAIWFTKSLQEKLFPYERIQILDEAIPHNKPSPHVDFLYTWFKLPILHKTKDEFERKLHDILNLSKSVSYDPLTQLIQVRCHFMGANRATLVLAILISTGHLSLRKIESNNLYSKFIMKTVSTHPSYDSNAEDIYEDQIRKFVEMTN